MRTPQCTTCCGNQTSCGGNSDGGKTQIKSIMILGQFHWHIRRGFVIIFFDGCCMQLLHTQARRSTVLCKHQSHIAHVHNAISI